MPKALGFCSCMICDCLLSLLVFSNQFPHELTIIATSARWYLLDDLVFFSGTKRNEEKRRKEKKGKREIEKLCVP